MAFFFKSSAVALALLSSTLLEGCSASITTNDLQQLGSPIRPRFWQRLKDREVATLSRQSGNGFLVQQDSNVLDFAGEKVEEPFEPHYFDQRTSHSPDSPFYNVTFPQRFYVDTQFYEPGGPVFLLDGGETSIVGRIPYLERGILRRLSEETGGIGILLEHRYYGESFPVENLTTDSLRFLDTETSLADNDYFAREVKVPGVDDLSPQSGTPWIIYGGSYAGAKAAFTRKRYPDTFMGGIASSAVTHATVNYWHYFEAIRLEATPRDCVEHLVNHTYLVDTLLEYGHPSLTKGLKSGFGLQNVTNDADFVSVLSWPMGTWQAGTWEETSGGRWEAFCQDIQSPGKDNSEVLSEEENEVFRLAGDILTLKMQVDDPTDAILAFRAYQEWFKKNVASMCDEEDQDKCFGTNDETQWQDTSLNQTWRSWQWQVCTEWGYFMPAPPDPSHPSIISKLIDIEYASQSCAAFQKGEIVEVPKWPKVDLINEYGDFDFSYPRLAFVDGDSDPWRWTTPHSPVAPHSKTRESTTSEPFLLIPGGRHHYDESGLLDHTQEPPEIQKVHEEEVSFVKSWLEDFEREKQLKVEA